MRYIREIAIKITCNSDFNRWKKNKKAKSSWHIWHWFNGTNHSVTYMQTREENMVSWGIIISHKSPWSCLSFSASLAKSVTILNTLHHLNVSVLPYTLGLLSSKTWLNDDNNTSRNIGWKLYQLQDKGNSYHNMKRTF